MAANSLVVDRADRLKALDRQRLGRFAILIALALHLTVPVSIIAPMFLHSRAAPPPDVPVTLVFEPPAAPQQPKAKAEEPPPAPPTPLFRRSGPDAETAGPRQAETSPEVPLEENPEPPPPPSALANTEPPAPEPPSPPSPTVEPAAPAPAKAAPETASPAEAPPEAIPMPVPKPPPPSPAKETPPHTAARLAEARHGPGPARLLAPQEKNGDPYINALIAQMRPHYLYPLLARPLGLRGVARLAIDLDRGGHLRRIELRQSSGSDLLDRAAEQMIRDAAPYPPPPPEMPGESVTIVIVAPYGPDQP